MTELLSLRQKFLAQKLFQQTPLSLKYILRQSGNGPVVFLEGPYEDIMAQVGAMIAESSKRSKKHRS